MNRELINKCKKTSTIFIYGAGTVADICFLFFKQNQVHDKVQAFVVTELDGNVIEKFGFNVIELPQNAEKLRNALVVVAVQHFIQDEIKYMLLEYGISNYFCINPGELLDDFYTELYLSPIHNNRILLQNQQGEGYGGNPKYIADELLRMDKESKLDLVWAVSRYRRGFPERVRQVLYGSEEYYRELASAKVWIDNSRKAYSIRKRDGQFYIQAWHGAAPIKRVEADVVDRLPEHYIESAKNDSKMADVFLSGSEFYTELYRKSFWYNGPILKFGLPRHDIFWNQEKALEKVHNFYKIERDVAIVLYAPTFRTCPNTECYDLDIERIVCVLKKKFHRRFRMMVSRHPVNHQEYLFKRGADYIYAGEYNDFQELLAAADVLITDYSGCMYDFSYTGRPVFLYQKDYNEYLKDRNFYIPMDSLPYIKAHSNRELEKAIEYFEMENYKSELEKFMSSMGNYDTGRASEKVVQYLRENVIEF